MAKVQYDTTYSAGIQRLVNSLYNKIRLFADSPSKRRPGIDLIDDVSSQQRIVSASVGLIPEILTTHVRNKIRANSY